MTPKGAAESGDTHDDRGDAQEDYRKADQSALSGSSGGLYIHLSNGDVEAFALEAELEIEGTNLCDPSQAAACRLVHVTEVHFSLPDKSSGAPAA